MTFGIGRFWFHFNLAFTEYSNIYVLNVKSCLFSTEADTVSALIIVSHPTHNRPLWSTPPRTWTIGTGDSWFERSIKCRPALPVCRQAGGDLGRECSINGWGALMDKYLTFCVSQEEELWGLCSPLFPRQFPHVGRSSSCPQAVCSCTFHWLPSLSGLTSLPMFKQSFSVQYIQ